jgi:hypothetical protein
MRARFPGFALASAGAAALWFALSGASSLAAQPAPPPPRQPCKEDPKYREFDFWVGTWDVLPNNAKPGAKPGVNVVTLEHGDCIVHEHWQGNMTGESFNLYDASRGAWFQTWVDSTGGMHEYRGGLDANGNMVFTAELAAGPGQATNERGRVPTRLTFAKLPGGQVRQLSEQSTDGGKSWQVSYDLIYTRRRE